MITMRMIAEAQDRDANYKEMGKGGVYYYVRGVLVTSEV